MKAIACFLIVGYLVCSVHADVLVFEGGAGESKTFGDSFEDVTNTWVSAVYEPMGLVVEAKTTNSVHRLNANSGYFGIDSDLADNVSDRFEVGEVMVLRFNKDIVITDLDFNKFDEGDFFTIEAGKDALSISFNTLKSTWYDTINLEPDLRISAGTEVRMYASSGSVGLDSITVIPEPTTLSLIGLFGVGSLAIRRLRRR